LGLSPNQALTEAGQSPEAGTVPSHVDAAAPRSCLFLEVTAQIPVGDAARSELTRLTFTPDTWSVVRDALALRDRHEIMLGWWHSHSYMKETCTDCDPSAVSSGPNGKERTCEATGCVLGLSPKGTVPPSGRPLQGDSPLRGQSHEATGCFMSRDDCRLHRLCFPRAFSVALVVGDSPCAGLSWALFGYRYGLISSRGFHLLGDAGRRDGTVPEVDCPGTKDAQRRGQSPSGTAPTVVKGEKHVGN